MANTTDRDEYSYYVGFLWCRGLDSNEQCRNINSYGNSLLLAVLLAYSFEAMTTIQIAQIFILQINKNTTLKQLTNVIEGRKKICKTCWI